MVDDTDSLIARTPEEFQKKLDITVHTGHEVMEIDPKTQRIAVQGEAVPLHWEPYDQLVVATGSTPIIPAWKGVDAIGVFAVKTLNDGVRIRQYIESQKPRHAVVVGGGYIGLEMAENLRHWDIETTLIEQQSEVMATLDADMGALVSQGLRDLGVNLYLGESVTDIEVKEGQIRAIRTESLHLPCDLLILGLGVKPESGLARAAGIQLGVKDAIRVDPYLRTNVSSIWAVGDVTESTNLITGQPGYVALATVANKQGRIAGLNLSGASVRFPGVLGTAITRVGTLEVARTGVTVAEAKALQMEVIDIRIASETKLGYFPDVAPITVKLVVDAKSGQVFGGQIVGGTGSGKRIDTIAVAATAKMTVQDLVDLDLAYAPPFSDVWDPVQIAARALVSKLT